MRGTTGAALRRIPALVAAALYSAASIAAGLGLFVLWVAVGSVFA